MPPILPGRPSPIFLSSSGLSTITHSVVIIRPGIAAAFCNECLDQILFRDLADARTKMLLPGRCMQELDRRIGAMTGLRTLGLTDNRLTALTDCLLRLQS